ncbi:MAG: hypothetical protein ACRD15_19325, partial [Vicinamibacterales bacterium]
MMTRLMHFGLSAALLIVVSTARPLSSQNPEFDLLIKNGHVLDSRNGIDAVMDVGVAGAKIARVASNIDASLSRR